MRWSVSSLFRACGRPSSRCRAPPARCRPSPSWPSSPRSGRSAQASCRRSVVAPKSKDTCASPCPRGARSSCPAALTATPLCTTGEVTAAAPPTAASPGLSTWRSVGWPQVRQESARRRPGRAHRQRKAVRSTCVTAAMSRTTLLLERRAYAHLHRLLAFGADVHVVQFAAEKAEHVQAHFVAVELLGEAHRAHRTSATGVDDAGPRSPTG